MSYKQIRVLILLFTILSRICFSQTLLTNPFLVKRSDSSTIQYYLKIKEKDRPNKNLLMILQGSDCNSVINNPAVKRLQVVYPDADLLLVEKYGITDQLSYSNEPERKDCPESYLTSDYPEQRVKDVDTVLNVLRKQYGYSKIIVVGGSEGSLIANILSSRVNYICATVLFGGGGRYFLDDVLYSMTFTSKKKENLDKDIDGFKQLSQYILSHEPFKFSMSNHGYTWWRSMLSFDQEALLCKIKNPVLIVQGGEDQSASPQKATEMFTELQKQGKTNIEYKLYQGYNHSLNLSINDNSADKIIADINKWLSSKVNK